MRPTRITLVLTAAVALAGCSQAVEASRANISTQAATSGTSTAPVAAPSSGSVDQNPTPTPGTDAAGIIDSPAPGYRDLVFFTDGPVSDSAGHEFLVTVNLGLGTDVKREVVDDDLRHASAIFPLLQPNTTADGEPTGTSVMNEIEGTEAPAAFAESLVAVAVHSTDTEVCNLPQAVDFGGDGQRCALVLGESKMPPSELVLPSYQPNYLYLAAPTSDDGTLRISGIPEEQWDVVVEQVLNPSSLMLLSTGADAADYPDLCSVTWGSGGDTESLVVLADPASPPCDGR